MTQDAAEFRYRGSIVRIRIRNFMTYTDTELKPGPNLNMILGPNGAGKSAVVCCIIVGLAGDVSLTGRGGSPADFVKKGKDNGYTEIELFNDRGKNYIIERKITITARSKLKLDHKSEWRINNKSVLKSDVLALTKTLNIKVDNLCQFLPQDSVTQFVKMNTCELLTNTLKAAGDNQLVDDHQKLVEYTRDVEEKRLALQKLELSCKENEVNAKRLESEVHQLRQREALVKERNICGQKIYYVKYLEAKSNCDEAQNECDRLKENLSEIECRCEPYLRAMESRKAEEVRIAKAIEKSTEELRTATNLIQQTHCTIENRKMDCQDEFAKFKGKHEQESQRESTIRLKQQELESLEARLKDIRDVDCSRQIKKIEGELDAKKKARYECNKEKSKIDDLLRSQLVELDERKREMEQIQAVKDKKTSLLRSTNPDAHKVMEWLSKNTNKFKRPIYPPLMCEINVKDPKYSRIVENAIPRQELMSFLCETADDLQTFTRIVRDELKIRPNVILAPDKTMRQFENDTSKLPDRRRLGVVAYMKDLVDAPEPIMRHLCGSHAFHIVPVADSCDESQLKQLLEQCKRFYVGNNFYSTSISRYDNKPMTVSDSVREAQFLCHSLDVRKLNMCKEKYQKVMDTRAAALKERDEIFKRDDQLKADWSALGEKYKELKSQHDEKNKLEALIQRLQEAIQRLKTEKVDIEVERGKLQQSIDKINNQIVKSLEKLGEIYGNFARLKEIHMANLLLFKVAERNHKVARKLYNAAQRDTTRLKESIRKMQNDLGVLSAALNEHLKNAEEKIPNFKNGKLTRSLKDKFASIQETTIEDLTNKREELTLRIQRIYKDANNSILHEFNKQNEELKDKKFRISELEASIKQIDILREQIKKVWLPKLQEVIEVIDKNYCNFMKKLNYAGQVKLDYDPEKPNNFAVYGILILVKYRDNEELIPLSSTRQSGGERSVATMIYMLALQTKTTAPFRCVDEINQGMDKDNERKVFELLVQTADSSSSQYFLVSPKLLNDLPYSEKMKIHVVFNGKKLDLAWNKLLAKRFTVK